jgi:hypothetical protein
MTELLTLWGSFYANHATIRSLIAFFHVGALITGGGVAVAADRSLLMGRLHHGGSRKTLLEGLASTHRFVIISLMVIGVSGALLFAADYDTLVYSRIFWIKMGLVAALAVNGGLLWRAERRAMTGDDSAWRTLRTTSIASITLWMLTTLGGVVLPNIG